jgi:hypothetical protein
VYYFISICSDFEFSGRNEAKTITLGRTYSYRYFHFIITELKGGIDKMNAQLSELALGNVCLIHC